VYERGVKIFKYPHVKAIWVTYLTKFVQRYKRSKLERARELFHEAVQQVCKVTLALLHACLPEPTRFLWFYTKINHFSHAMKYA
jgi:hypothetical protein